MWALMPPLLHPAAQLSEATWSLGASACPSVKGGGVVPIMQGTEKAQE